MTISHGDLTIDWLGYATVRIEDGDGTVVYLDPGRYGTLTGEWTPDTEGVGHPPAQDYDARDGDLVCVTHDHHYDSDGVRRVAREDATVLAYDAVYAPGIGRDVERLGDLSQEVVRVDEHEDRLVEDVIVRTIAAYNEPDGPHVDDSGEPYHPEGFGVGFHLTFGDTTVFWPGDSDVLDGHEELDVDVFLPSISGNFTMDRHEAADLAAALDPDLVVPIHYNTFAGLEADSEAFALDLAERGIPVALDE
ncbi:L-ascorbate metabolism protein UlaG, beta-lactamase superfamily [Natronoarchaeum philippinense]|uniref:L-ascorbate metabolism protein UlaG, beta-lactamase superfamily n=1 Tax=Natronoarchaeum philippinense TaxID=558529 RepID=A0A285N611_NATPI|nr:MBL fold metallo-hydrolase [Natronoarchaeum philippinense]SNZ04383.1 L-ascorbate metabolism protein UlaG, beta-lactamase superfamily [Natronoarchaeum philippinense]